MDAPKSVAGASGGNFRDCMNRHAAVLSSQLVGSCYHAPALPNRSAVLSTVERVERRLTAILAADVAGYSRLMGADEEGTLAQLKAHRRALVDPKITEQRG